MINNKQSKNYDGTSHPSQLSHQSYLQLKKEIEDGKIEEDTVTALVLTNKRERSNSANISKRKSLNEVTKEVELVIKNPAASPPSKALLKKKSLNEVTKEVELVIKNPAASP